MELTKVKISLTTVESGSLKGRFTHVGSSTINPFLKVPEPTIASSSPAKDEMKCHPAVEVPPWPVLEDLMDDVYSPLSSHISDGGNASPAGGDYWAALRQFLPTNLPDQLDDEEGGGREAPDAPVDAYSSDHFRMYEFKVRRCTRGRSHDWTECPFAHPGEKARRRDPRKYHYSGASCPEFKKGTCRQGEACEYAHGVFECWLHPARYRTQPCKDGANCRRRVCFFAHTPEQLRVITQHSPRSGGSGGDVYEVSPQRQTSNRNLPFLASSEDSDSPPLSPMTQTSVSDLLASLRNLQLVKVKSLPSTWTSHLGCPSYGSGSGSPRRSMLWPSSFSVPTTPTKTPARPKFVDLWENSQSEEPGTELVESGRGLRTGMFSRLGKENHLELGQTDPEEAEDAPDVGWVSELVM